MYQNQNQNIFKKHENSKNNLNDNTHYNKHNEMLRFIQKQHDIESISHFAINYEILDKIIGFGGEAIVYDTIDRNNKHNAVITKKYYNIADLQRLKQIYHSYQLQKQVALTAIHSKMYYEFAHKNVLHESLYLYTVEQKLGHNLEEYVIYKMHCKLHKTEIKKIIFDILECLAVIHSKEICHLDIHPMNIIYNERTQRWMIIDFGLADYCDENGRVFWKVSQGRHPFKSIDKNPNRMNLFLSKKTDIFEVAITAFWLLIGKQYPITRYDLGNEQEIQNNIYPFLDVDGVDPKDWFSDLYEFDKKRIRNCIRYNQLQFGTDLSDLLYKMLEFDPNKRITAVNALKHKWFKSLS